MKVTKTTRLLGRPPVITNAHGAGSPAGKIRPGEELHLEGTDFRAVMEGYPVIVKYPTSERDEETIAVPAESVTGLTSTHMCAGMSLLDIATIGGTVKVEATFADGKIATATAEIIGD